MMAGMLLNGSGFPSGDAADAIAVAITHARIRVWARDVTSRPSA
jgi:Holliday junction resolvasome RuvABC endonuclease subunit